MKQVLGHAVSHAPARIDPPAPVSLEVLERRAARYQLEVMVEGCDTHASPLGHLVGAERPGVLGVDVLQDPGDAGEVVIPSGQGTQRVALLTAKHAIDDFSPSTSVRCTPSCTAT
jgi:hypothetical protein